MKTPANAAGWLIALLLATLITISAYRHGMPYLQVATIAPSVAYTTKQGYEHLARAAAAVRKNGAPR